METEGQITHINICYVREVPEQKYSWKRDGASGRPHCHDLIADLWEVREHAM